MWWLTRGHLARQVDTGRVTAAVAAAEARTTGEIVVSISPFFWGSVEAAARRAFARLGVAGTEERNGLLLFFVPSRRRFVVLGDQGVDARVGKGFWDGLATSLAAELRKGDLTTAVIHGVERAGAALAEHFPARGPRQNRLADGPDVRKS
jgi:uncharacterized membrane protein